MRLITIFLICLTYSVQAGVKELYLPVWNERESTQVISLHLTGLPAQELEVYHSCGITSDTNQFTPVNGTADITLTLDLHKLASTFTVFVLGKNQSGKFDVIIQRVDLHLSLVPETFRLSANAHTFKLASLTHNPLDISKVSNVVITNKTDTLVSGTYEQPAVITLASGENIRIKPNLK